MYLKQKVYLLLGIFIFITSCNGDEMNVKYGVDGLVESISIKRNGIKQTVEFDDLGSIYSYGVDYQSDSDTDRVYIFYPNGVLNTMYQSTNGKAFQIDIYNNYGCLKSSTFLKNGKIDSKRLYHWQDSISIEDSLN